MCLPGRSRTRRLELTLSSTCDRERRESLLRHLRKKKAPHDRLCDPETLRLSDSPRPVEQPLDTRLQTLDSEIKSCSSCESCQIKTVFSYQSSVISCEFTGHRSLITHQAFCLLVFLILNPDPASMAAHRFNRIRSAMAFTHCSGSSTSQAMVPSGSLRSRTLITNAGTGDGFDP